MANNFTHKAVIIVGAGMAGISCAGQLKKLGFKNVKLLEARDRVGGRMHTIIHKSNPLEFGAQWIHGEDGNPIYELCRENNLIDDDAPNYMEAVLTFKNVELSSRSIIGNAFHILNEAMENELLTSGGSLEDSLKVAFKTEVADLVTSGGAEKYKKSLYRCYDNLMCEINGCETSNLVSANLTKSYTEYPGKHTVEHKGYDKLLNLLLNDIPAEWIIKNKRVSKLDWSNGRVKVVCEDGSSFVADHVVVTLPLGCLKNMNESMFVPCLPERKMEAIRCLGYGTVNKVYLEFECPFWNASDIYMVLLENLDEEKNQTESPLWNHINRFAYVPHQRNMLCAWVTGNGALQLEKMSTDKIAADCLTLLQKLLNKPDLPQPSEVFVSKWSSDPYSYGSYSYLSMECEKSNIAPTDLAEPIFAANDDFKHPTLMFAGEATHPHCFSTVHGAYETGLREANRLHSSYLSHNELAV